MSDTGRAAITSQVSGITALIEKYQDYGISNLNPTQNNALSALIEKKNYEQSLLREDQQVRDYQGMIANGVPEAPPTGDLNVKIDAKLSGDGVMTITKIDKPSNIDLSFYKKERTGAEST